MQAFSQHPQWPRVKATLDLVHRAGFQAWLAGGCVRDALLGITPKDFDVATNARPDQLTPLFPNALLVGQNFGVTIVPIGNGEQIELATFRRDGAYLDGRRPESVEFSSAEEDAKRRDFTVNAMFFDPEKDQVIDFVGGEKDLRDKILRTVGRPVDRFTEDKLRILRAVRFVSQLGFTLEENTLLAVTQMSDQITQVSPERIHQEMLKMLGTDRPALGLKLMGDTGIWRQICLGLVNGDSGQRLELRTQLIDAVYAGKVLTLSSADQRAQVGLALVRLAQLAVIIACDSSAQALFLKLLKALRVSNFEYEWVQKVFNFPEDVRRHPLIGNKNEAYWARWWCGPISKNIFALWKEFLEVQSPFCDTEKSKGHDVQIEQLRSIEGIQARLVPDLQLPQELVTGDQLRVLYPAAPAGAEFGRLLREIQDLQITKKLTSKAHILTWIRQNSK